MVTRFLCFRVVFQEKMYRKKLLISNFFKFNNADTQMIFLRILCVFMYEFSANFQENLIQKMG
jgi:hypothetical protein